jgi:hypothetical protein
MCGCSTSSHPPGKRLMFNRSPHITCHKKCHAPSDPVPCTYRSAKAAIGVIENYILCEPSLSFLPPSVAYGLAKTHFRHLRYPTPNKPLLVHHPAGERGKNAVRLVVMDKPVHQCTNEPYNGKRYQEKVHPSNNKHCITPGMTII